MDDIEEALTDLRSTREQLNLQLLNRHTLDDLARAVPPEEITRLKAAYATRMSDTVNVLHRVNRAIDVLESGVAGALQTALLCLQGHGEELALPLSTTCH